MKTSLDTATAKLRGADAVVETEDNDATILIGTDDTVTEDTLAFVTELGQGVKRAFVAVLEDKKLLQLQDAQGRIVWQGHWRPERIDDFTESQIKSITAAYQTALVEHLQAAQTVGIAE